MDAAASLMLLRPGADGPEVLLGRRAAGSLLEGAWAFPGGSVAEGDARPSARLGAGGLADDDRARRVAALRELFEETGILALPGAAAVPAARLAPRRVALREGKLAFTELLEAEGLEADLAAVVPTGRWRLEGFVVPALDIVLHRLHLPEGAAGEGSPFPAEVSALRWWRPEAALAAFDAGELALPETVRRPLASLVARGADASDLGGGAPGRHEPLRGTRLVPVRTPTLPPATHTNVYVLGTGAERVVVDPASPWDDAQARLDAVLDDLAAEGARVSAIWLTHHHPDHVGGVAHLKARLKVPVKAHGRTAERLPAGLVDALIDDGDETRLEGPLTQTWTAIHTPGHAPGHLCFHDRSTGAVVVGDMMAGVGTIVIDPPEGDMAAYFDSLRRLKALEPAMPRLAHGPPSAEAVTRIETYLAHRQAREDAILASLEAGPRAIRAVVEAVYTDVPPALYPFADRSVLAHLEKLAAEGKVSRQGEVWSPR